MSKQDRCAPRTASDLERRYKFKAKFQEVLGVAEDAQRAAQQAANLDGLTADQIFDILTDGGKVQGLYRENGQIYFNASFIKTGILLASLLKTGVIVSEDGLVEIDLTNSKVTVYAPDKSHWFEMGSGTIKHFQKDENGNPVNTLTIDPGASFGRTEITNPGGVGGISLAGIAGPTMIGGVTGTEICGETVGIEGTESAGIIGKTVAIYGTQQVLINGKAVSWKDNGDGTYTLVGT